MHQVVTAQLAAARGGTQTTQTRAEVRGGGKKPWRQKGTGRARQGSTRSPHWVGGGVALGPKPRDYRQKTPKKMVQLALRSALSDRAATGKVAVVDAWGFAEPKTSEAVSGARGARRRGARCSSCSTATTRPPSASFRNLPDVHVVLPGAQRLRRPVQRLARVLQGTLPGGETVPATQTSAPVEPPETTEEVAEGE